MEVSARPPLRLFFLKVLGPALPLFIALATAAPAQQSSDGSPRADAATQVFAPFVSRLKATAEGSRIVLTWRNPKDVEGAKLVYRSQKPISEQTFDAAQLIARLSNEAIRYEDTPPSRSGYYYAVLVEDREGGRYELFIPFRNITSREVQVASLVAEEDLSADVSEISARAVEDGVEVRFRSSKGGRELLLFRSASVITDGSDLLEAAAPVSLDSGASLYVDYPIPGIGYYYCVVDAGLFKLGKAEPVPGKNATTSPVQIPIGVGRVALPVVPSPPPLPLPYLLLQSGVESGEELAPAAPFRLPEAVKPLSPQTRWAVARIMSTTPQPAAGLREFQLLREDRQSTKAQPALGTQTRKADQDIGEHAVSLALTDIVGGELVRSNPGAAALLLEDFLRIRHSEAVEDRAHFYLGQMYYQTGRYREAVLEFLLARDSYYRISEEWLADCVRRLWQLD
jgi:hypothetical protein